MIRTKKDFKYYVMEDAKNNNYNKKFFNPTRKYLLLLRKTEYHINNKHKILSIVYRFRLKLISNKYLTYIPINSADSGLSLPHLGCIYINGNSKIGKNCSIHEMVNIGATSGNDKSPVLGNNVFIGSGAKVIGDIYIADDVAIGAGAVVVKSINEKGTTWAGCPAKKISNKDSHCHLKLFKQ